MFGTVALLCSLQLGSGVRWNSLYSGRERDGSGPPNIIFQVSTRQSGASGYRISIYEDDPKALVAVKDFPDSVRFRSLETHYETLNDFYPGKDRVFVKVFPKVWFVGHGLVRGKPMTYVWDPGNENGRTPNLVLRVFDGDVRQLDDPGREHKRRTRYVIERAVVRWLPLSTRPPWARLSDHIRRVWFRPEGRYEFTPGPWKKAW